MVTGLSWQRDGATSTTRWSRYWSLRWHCSLMRLSRSSSLKVRNQSAFPRIDPFCSWAAISLNWGQKKKHWNWFNLLLIDVVQQTNRCLMDFGTDAHHRCETGTHFVTPNVEIWTKNTQFWPFNSNLDIKTQHFDPETKIMTLKHNILTCTLK